MGVKDAGEWQNRKLLLILLLIVIDHVVRTLLLGLPRKQNMHLDEYITPQTLISPSNKNFQTTENLMSLKKPTLYTKP